MIKISGSLLQAYEICPRQAWLMSRQITADQQNTYLDIGRLISQESFAREKKEIYIPDLAAKIDYIKKKDGEFFVAEVKKSSATMESGIEQLKYYLFLLEKKGIQAKGLIKIPKEKKSMEIELTEEDKKHIKAKISDLQQLIEQENPPTVKKIKQCKSCAHYEFCFS